MILLSWDKYYLKRLRTRNRKHQILFNILELNALVTQKPAVLNEWFREIIFLLIPRLLRFVASKRRKRDSY